MKKRSIILLGVLIIFLTAFVAGCSGVVSIANTDITQKNLFKSKYKNRTAFYDKMKKTFRQKAQISVQNDSSFRKNIDLIMAGRKDGEQTMFKWIQESNPNANYEQVADLYKDLSRTIEAQRDEFFKLETELSDIVRENDNLSKTFPNNIVLGTFLGRQSIEYQPISSDETEQVIKTGKDNDTKVF